MSWTAAVITISDKGYRGERVDTSGPALVNRLKQEGWEVVYQAMVPDEITEIQRELKDCADLRKVQLVLTTGGTGFSPRDVTPEATRSIIEREVPGIPEVMRSESMKLTPHGCLSRGVAGIRGRTLMVNLPGSEKAAKENLEVVLGSLGHGIKMLCSEGSAECAQGGLHQSRAVKAPSLDGWLEEAKADPQAHGCGMYLSHRGVVRRSARAQVRGNEEKKSVSSMQFSFCDEKVAKAVECAKTMDGIYYVRVWLNRGQLQVGDDIMQVLIGGDIRPRVIQALEWLVEELKTNCVVEEEQF